MSFLNGVGAGDLDKKQGVLDLDSRGFGCRFLKVGFDAEAHHDLWLRGRGGVWNSRRLRLAGRQSQLASWRGSASVSRQRRCREQAP